jgi:hypothetical protein
MTFEIDKYDDTIADWAMARLRDAVAEGAIDSDTSEGVLQREAAKLTIQIHQLASSFIDNDVDESE